jgi:ketosteroid isomerase-like protein
MQSMTPAEAREFAARWLPAWTGNDPLRLASFYTEDLFYSDPTLPDGVTGKKDFIRYLSELQQSRLGVDARIGYPVAGRFP